MRDISFRPAGFNYGAPVPEAQDRLDQHAAGSQPTAAAAPPARAPGVHRGPKAMSSRQAALLGQFEAGPSTRPRQEGVQHSSGAALSDEQLAQLNQTVLADFRRKADADPRNMPLTKDYYLDVLAEVADWLKQQTRHLQIRSLSGLQRHLNNEGADKDTFIQNLADRFNASGATPVTMGHRKNSPEPLPSIILALDQSLGASQLELPPADISRQEERLLHAFKTVGVRQGRSERTLKNQELALKHLCQWLHKQTPLDQPIPHGLDSLEKLRDHPNENDVDSLINRFKYDPAIGSSARNNIRTAVNNLWKWVPQAPAPAESRTAQPALQQRHFGPLNQSANLAPPHNPGLSEPSFTSSEAALLNRLFQGKADEQDDASSAIPHAQAPEAPTSGAQPHGVRRPAPEVENEPRAVRPRLDGSPLPATFEELERFPGI